VIFIKQCSQRERTTVTPFLERAFTSHFVSIRNAPILFMFSSIPKQRSQIHFRGEKKVCKQELQPGTLVEVDNMIEISSHTCRAPHCSPRVHWGACQGGDQPSLPGWLGLTLPRSSSNFMTPSYPLRVAHQSSVRPALSSWSGLTSSRSSSIFTTPSFPPSTA